MQMFYSPSTGGFYAVGINPDVPTDAIPISQEEHQTLLAGQAIGQVIAIVDGQLGLAAPATPTLTIAQQVTLLVQAASSASSSIVSQIYSDATHQAAFQNAAMLLSGNGGAPPTADPFRTAFNSLAAVYGAKPSAFATMVAGLQTASLQLSVALSTLTMTASAVEDAAGLGAALKVFETTVADIVSTINAADGPVRITAPAAISIPGLTS